MTDDKLKPRTVLTSAGYIADEDDDIQVYQRPWVGLTDENMETLILKHAPPIHPDYEDDSLHGLLQAANDFLRELNT